MISPAPAKFDGKFSEFYHCHVEPNLPTKERVEAFDLMLRNHLSDDDPVFVMRYAGE